MLLLKLLLTPLFILIITLIGRRWGSLVSGWLVGLPLTSAPVVLFLALEQGTAFASRAALLGPRLSGLLPLLPIFASIFGAFTHAFQGAPAARRVLRGALAGSYAFAVFFLPISGLINNVGIASAFALATLAAFVVQGSSLWLLQRY